MINYIGHLESSIKQLFSTMKLHVETDQTFHLLFVYSPKTYDIESGRFGSSWLYDGIKIKKKTSR